MNPQRDQALPDDTSGEPELAAMLLLSGRPPRLHRLSREGRRLAFSQLRDAQGVESFIDLTADQPYVQHHDAPAPEPIRGRRLEMLRVLAGEPASTLNTYKFNEVDDLEDMGESDRGEARVLQLARRLRLQIDPKGPKGWGMLKISGTKSEGPQVRLLAEPLRSYAIILEPEDVLRSSHSSLPWWPTHAGHGSAEQPPSSMETKGSGPTKRQRHRDLEVEVHRLNRVWLPEGAIQLHVRLINHGDRPVTIIGVELALPGSGVVIRAFPFSFGPVYRPDSSAFDPPGRYLTEEIERGSPTAPRLVGVDPLDPRPLDPIVVKVPERETWPRWLEFRSYALDSLVPENSAVRGDLIVEAAGPGRLVLPVELIRVGT
ncbi:MAG: hypothetical protein H6746_17150 [Deltaproteobacteria bacterium]|nr:hypothetical protein [Deltaproteobacteria bacterium]